MSRLILVAALLFACTACAPTIPHAINDSSRSLVQMPASDKATVVFVGQKTWMFTLYDNDATIGVAGDDGCAVVTVPPGKHLFATFFKKAKLMDGRSRFSFIDAELSPGKFYYILVRPYIISFAGVFADLEPIREKNDPKGYWQKLPAWLAECKITTMTDETLAWGKERYTESADEYGWDMASWSKDEDRQKKAIYPDDGVTMPVAPKK